MQYMHATHNVPAYSVCKEHDTHTFILYKKSKEKKNNYSLIKPDVS